MWKMGYLEATNYVAFKSALGLNHVTFDLMHMLDKNFFLILGDNGSGKSIFASMIHPAHTPIAHNEKFVIRGKEGILLRRYYGPDNTVVETRIVSTPKNSSDDNEWTHSNKAFFAVGKTTDDELEELGGGTVGEYYKLLYKYFNITPDMLLMCIYNKRMEGLVAMSSADRIKNMTNLFPNSSDIMSAHKLSIEQYRIYKNNYKNISQKLGSLRNESELRNELKIIEEAYNKYSKKREKYIEELAVLKADRSKLISDENSNINKEYKQLINDLQDTIDRMKRVKDKLKKYTDIDSTKLAMMLEKKISEKALIDQRYKDAESQITEIETDVSSLIAELNSFENNDIDSLKEEKKVIQHRMKDLSYHNYVGQFDNLNFATAQVLHNSLEMIGEEFNILVDHYGELVNSYFGKSGPFKNDYTVSDYEKLYNKLNIQYIQVSDDMENISKEINSYESKRYLSDILGKRPTQCKIDSCAFIEEALGWNEIEKDLHKASDKMNKISKVAATLQEEMDATVTILKFLKDVKSFENILSTTLPLTETYLKVTKKELYSSFKKGRLHDIFTLEEVKDIMAILSEKDHYENLEKTLLEIDTIIDRLQSTDTMRRSLEVRLEKIQEKESKLYKIKKDLKESRDLVLDEIDELTDNIKSAEEREEYLKELDTLSELVSVLTSRIDIMKEKIDILEIIESNITSIKEKKDELDQRLSELLPKRDTTKFELNHRLELEVQRSEMEREYIIREIITNMTKPGKGMWRKLFNIYMDNIRVIANLILSNTFDGDLELAPVPEDTKALRFPYSYKGVLGHDASEASGAQRAAISISLALGIVESFIADYGIMVFDEADKDMSVKRKYEFARIMMDRSGILGLSQTFIITHSPENYLGDNVGYILFPGHTIDKSKLKKDDYFVVKAKAA